ncbi:Retrograde regulation protein 2 [Golovinomyces cichoracearum]|uniref:Retrograde regulation protein 2 n=1 Tax=Golovinomyces cichoracearum TaxID=62708 RepID=A0A420IJ56_9PEZI|nr:Retrograde regulation protein 2 [Golovinomyces cichoracearum]
MAGVHVTLQDVSTVLSSSNEASSDLYGLVDMGSNGIRFSISDLRPPSSRLLTCIYHERTKISLYDALHGSSPDSKSLYFSEQTITQVAETLGRFQKICVANHVPPENILIFATEAMRTAKNQDQMLDAIRVATGLTVKILTPQVETLFGAMGARSGFAQVDGLLMDLGGGSVQITYVNSSLGPNYEFLSAEAAHSLPFGAARLTEVMSDPTTAKSTQAELQKLMKKSIESLVQKFPELHAQFNSEEGVTIYFSGGGFRGYGSILMHTDPIQPYPIPAIGGYSVPGSRFKKWPEMLLANKKAGQIFGLSKRRRHQFPAIAMVVDAVSQAIPRIKSTIFCTGGNREGLLLMKLPSLIREMDPFPLIPSPVTDRNPCTISSIVNLLIAAFPPNHSRSLSIFTPKLLSHVAHRIWIFQGLNDNPSRALYSAISEARAALPSLTHDHCAILALTLSARWGFDLGPVDLQVVQNLQKIVGPEITWWCRYIGRACHFLSIVFPTYPTDLEPLEKALRLEAISNKYLGKNENTEGIQLNVYLVRRLCQGKLGGVDSQLKDVWKKIGKGLGDTPKLKVEIIFPEQSVDSDSKT